MKKRTSFFEAFASRKKPDSSRILRPEASYSDEDLLDLLVAKSPQEVLVLEIQQIVEGNLWMLSSDSYIYFLPAFLQAALDEYDALSVFASELVLTLTKPSRQAIQESLNRFVGNSSQLSLPETMKATIVQQQLEWFDSGTPSKLFHDRFDHFSSVEGRAVLKFFEILQQARSHDFPFGELEAAIDLHWEQFRAKE